MKDWVALASVMLIIPAVVVGGVVAAGHRDDPATKPRRKREPAGDLPVAQHAAEKVHRTTASAGTSTVAWENGFGLAKSVGLGGAFWFAADQLGSTIEGVCGEGACTPGLPEKLCVQGSVGMVDNQDWAGKWGAALGWNLSQDQHGEPRALQPNQLQAVSFRLQSAAGLLPSIRFGTRIDGKDYCLPVDEGEHRIRMTDLKENCWDDESPHFDRNLGPTSVKWQVVALPTRAVPYHFCISAVGVEAHPHEE